MRFGFPIRTSPDQRSFASFPGLIAGCRVLRRLSMPRHPPYTLKSLATFTDRRPPLGRPAPFLRKTRRVNRTAAAPPGRGGGGRCCRLTRAPKLRPPRGEPRSRTEWAGRPVMGQLSPKKVLDDARPTESTNLERRTVGTVRTPPGVGITPDAGADVADPADQITRPARPPIAVRPHRKRDPLGLLP